MEHGSPPPPWHWDEMLEEFCALGGAARNISPGSGRSRPGLFAINPKDAVLLRVPRNLLLPLEDIEYIGGQVRVRDSAGASEPERRFFAKYETVSWGAEGQAGTIAFISGLDALPAQIRELLSAELGLGHLLEADLGSRVQTHFLRGRAVRWQGTQVIAPLLELANHGAEGLRYERGKHLQIQGYVRDEVTVRHVAEDAYAVFCRFGVAERQPAAFSLPMKAQVEDREIVIGRKMNEGVMRGQDRAPKMTVDGHLLRISYLILGHSRSPRLPRGMFCRLLRDAGLRNPDEAFDRVVHLNALKFIKLLKVMEPHEGKMISLLRTMARYQLEAMYDCVGSREIGSASVPLGQL